jgi:hypothetical protein
LSWYVEKERLYHKKKMPAQGLERLRKQKINRSYNGNK